jgi:UDP-N-acetylmuramate--alanine ligase
MGLTLKEWSQKLTQKDAPLRVHLIGVAGSGMSGLALLLIDMGHQISGSDRVTSPETERMQSIGLDFSSPHTAAVVEKADLVVYSSAIRPENPSYAAAHAAGIPLMRRAECLAAILQTKKGIVISGTHGKTTTSAMSAHIMREANFRPSYYVGAEIPVLGPNAKWQKDGDFMIAEGDESDGTLVLYQPECSIVLNIEAEHLDFYRDLDHICEVFTKLLDQTRRLIVYCKECPVATELCKERENAVSCGWSNADYTAVDIRELRGTTSFNVARHGKILGEVELGIPGRHNILNALAAITASHELGADFTLLSKALSSFAGAKRRFETKYVSSKLRIVDDYGHHPTELAATLQTARSLNPKRIVVLFQPHRYSRTQALATDFGKALQAADLVFVTDVYAASEKPVLGVSGETIINAVKLAGNTKVFSAPDLEVAHHMVGNALEDGDLFITLGAGNVHEAGSRIANDIKVLEEIKSLVSEDDLTGKLYEPMRRHTTILVGGPAQFWIEPRTFEAFAKTTMYCRERGIAFRVVGRGSNLLVRDGGIRGVVICPSGGVFSEVREEYGFVIAGAGARLKKVASVAQSFVIGGFEWMEGVPGNVGGALCMNAGAMGVEMFDHVVSITLLDEKGEIIVKQRDEMIVNYRSAPELKRNFALQVVLKGTLDSAENIQTRWSESRQKRKVSQPIAASAGCMFKNPTQLPAGKLVDELGMKGLTYGGAEISMAHGNFIINKGGAKASEILFLVDQIKDLARKERGVEMEMEVNTIGEDEYTF